MKIRIIGKRNLPKANNGLIGPPICPTGQMPDPNNPEECIDDPNYKPDNTSTKVAISQPMTFINPGYTPPGFNNNALKGNNNLVIGNNAPAGYSQNYQTMGFTPTISTTGMTGGFNWNVGNTDIQGNSTVPSAPVNPDATPKTKNPNYKPAQLYECPKGYTKDPTTGKCKKKTGFFGDNMTKAQKIGMVGQAFDIYSGYASAISNVYQNREKNRAADLNNRLTYTTPTVDWKKDKGDYTMNYGYFRPDEVGFNSPGQFKNTFEEQRPIPQMVGQYGGTLLNDSTMKIRIVGLPNKMAYGGQSGYGFDLGQRNTYTAMPKNPYAATNDTVSEDPNASPDDYVLEAEDKETIVTPKGLIKEIKGKRHPEGGVKLTKEQAPQGSFIFSDTKKMTIKDPAILNQFGMKPRKAGYTPAEVSKSFPINKYRAILADPKADSVTKRTAELMVMGYEKKLAQLMVVQEDMKDFPQGMPDLAKKVLPEAVEMEKRMPKQMYGGDLEYGGYIPTYGEYAYGGGINNGFMYRDNQFATGGQYMEGMSQMGNDLPMFAFAGQTDDVDPYAPLTDPDYPKFQALLKKYGTVLSDGRINIKNIDPSDMEEFAKYTTKFGFDRSKEGGHHIVQSGTDNYVIKRKGKKSIGFFGGYTPQAFEEKVTRTVTKPDEFSKMSELEKRKTFLKTIGVDISKFSDADLSDPKKLYNDPIFLKKTLYPAFTKTYPKAGFRPEIGDDTRFGAEHYKAITVPPSKTTGYKCVTAADGTKSVQSQVFDDDAAMTAAGYGTNAAASAECMTIPRIPEIPEDPKPKYICAPDGAGGVKAVLSPVGYLSEAEALANCPGEPLKKIPFKFLLPDRMAMAATAAIPPIKINQWIPGMKLKQPIGTFYDPTRELAAGMEAANAITQGYQGTPQGYSAASNATQLAAGKNAADVLGRYNNLNVGVANTLQEKQADVYNTQAQYDAARAKEIYAGQAIADQQYNNELRDYLNKNVKAYSNAWKNRMYMDQINKSIGRKFYTDPDTGEYIFRGNRGGIGSLGNDYDGSDGNDIYNLGTTAGTLRKSYIEQLKKTNPGMSDEEAKEIANTLVGKAIGSQKSKSSSKVGNATTTQSGIVFPGDVPE